MKMALFGVCLKAFVCLPLQFRARARRTAGRGPKHHPTSLSLFRVFIKTSLKHKFRYSVAASEKNWCRFISAVKTEINEPPASCVRRELSCLILAQWPKLQRNHGYLLGSTIRLMSTDSCAQFGS